MLPPERPGGPAGVGGPPTLQPRTEFANLCSVEKLRVVVHSITWRRTRIVLDTALRSGDGVPDVLAVDHDSDPKLTSKLSLEFTRSIGSIRLILLVSSAPAYHKDASAREERVNWVLGYTLRAFANGRRVDWACGRPTPSSPSTTRPRDQTLFFIDWAAVSVARAGTARALPEKWPTCTCTWLKPDAVISRPTGQPTPITPPLARREG